jgi:hypothetical protein
MIDKLINLFPLVYSRFLFFFLPANLLYFELEVVKEDIKKAGKEKDKQVKL